MYNPVNMKVEDADRLLEKDIREKKKKQRYDVRYDVEQKTRREGIMDQMKQEEFGLNKISHMRYKEIAERGFDILTNDKIDAEKRTKIEGPRAKAPEKIWNQARKTVNSEFLSEKDKKHIQDEIEEDRMAATKATLAYHQQCQHEAMAKTGGNDPFTKTVFANRTNRVAEQEAAQAAESQAPASRRSQVVS
jgi:hypothetical protein